MGPFKASQPRVKTFDDLPLEIQSHKAPQVRPLLSSPSLLKNVTGNFIIICLFYFWWIFSFDNHQKIHLLMLKNLFHFHEVKLHLFSGQPDRQRDGSGLRGIRENRAQPQRHHPKKVCRVKAMILMTAEGWEVAASYLTCRPINVTHREKHADTIFSSISEQCARSIHVLCTRLTQSEKNILTLLGNWRTVTLWFSGYRN